MANSARASEHGHDLVKLEQTFAHDRRDGPFDLAPTGARPWSCQAHGRGFDASVLDGAFESLAFGYEPEEQLLWCRHGDVERPCYTPALLSDLRGLFALLRDLGSAPAKTSFPFRYLIWRSDMPGIWNLGGDLALFVRLIETENIEALREYAHACVDTVYQNFTKSDLPYLTIALVEGDALGGGFESVLSNDIVIAEEHAQFGLPEIMFSMFPGMGAYSFLSRRLGAAEARSMILSGRLYSAHELHERGLIDMVVPSGAGEAGLRSFLDRNRRRHRALLSMSKVSRRCGALDRAELIDVADIWVDNAMGISTGDLRRMQRLVKAQARRYRNAMAH